MKRTVQSGIPFFQFDIFQPHADIVRHAVFTRQSAIEDPQTVQKSLQTSARPVSFHKQLHSAEVAVFSSPISADFDLVKRQGDAFITDLRHTPLVIRIADCASIFLIDPVNRIIANIHAGWRGLAKNIIRKTVARFIERFGGARSNIIAAISPMIGPCCCRFSDPYRELPKFMHRFITEENTVDLWAAAEGQLRECGIKKENIENPRLCTSCHIEDFFSYRREGPRCGRFGTAIMLA